MYVRVHGHLRTFQNKLNVVAFSVRYVPSRRLQAPDMLLRFESSHYTLTSIIYCRIFYRLLCRTFVILLIIWSCRALLQICKIEC
jgi:hypothetical protein